MKIKGLNMRLISILTLAIMLTSCGKAPSLQEQFDLKNEMVDTISSLQKELTFSALKDNKEFYRSMTKECSVIEDINIDFLILDDFLTLLSGGDSMLSSFLDENPLVMYSGEYTKYIRINLRLSESFPEIYEDIQLEIRKTTEVKKLKSKISSIKSNIKEGLGKGPEYYSNNEDELKKFLKNMIYSASFAICAQSRVNLNLIGEESTLENFGKELVIKFFSKLESQTSHELENIKSELKLN